MLNREDALKRAQEQADYYGSGKYKGYEDITLPDGRPGIRMTFVPVTKEASMSTQDRDTHFAHAAKILFTDVEPLFRNRLYALEDGRLNEAEEDAQFIQNHIARFLYDLAFHLLKKTNPLWLDLSPFPDDDEVRESISHVPDLTERPTE